MNAENKPTEQTARQKFFNEYRDVSDLGKWHHAWDKIDSLRKRVEELTHQLVLQSQLNEEKQTRIDQYAEDVSDLKKQLAAANREKGELAQENIRGSDTILTMQSELESLRCDAETVAMCKKYKIGVYYYPSRGCWGANIPLGFSIYGEQIGEAVRALVAKIEKWDAKG